MTIYHYSAFENKINVSKRGSIGSYIYASLYPFKSIGDSNDIGNTIKSVTKLRIDEHQLIIFGKKWFEQIMGTKLGYYNQIDDEHAKKILQSDQVDLNNGINKLVYAQLMKRPDVMGIAFPHDTELGDDNLEIVIKPELL